MEAKDAQLQQKDAQLQHKDDQIQRQATELRERTLRQQRELQTLRVREWILYYMEGYSLVPRLSVGLGTRLGGIMTLSMLLGGQRKIPGRGGG